MSEKASIANFLKRYRQQHQETQFEFAANIGISEEELSLLERERVNVTIETLQKIAAYTGYAVWEIVYVEREGG